MRDPMPNEMSPMAELGQSITDAEERCATEQWWGAGFWVGIIKHVYADVKKAWRKFRDEAHQAEVLEAEALAALKQLEEHVKAGRVTNDDLRLLRHAEACTERSIRLDHDLSEQASE